MGSLKRRLHSSAAAAGGAANTTVADALKASISSVPIPIVSGFVGWAVSEFVTTLTDHVKGALDRSKQCQELKSMICDDKLNEVIGKLDQLADRYQASRDHLFKLCELISDVNLILCVAESEQGGDCCTTVVRCFKSMSHSSIQMMKQVVKELRDYVQDHKQFLVFTIAAEGGLKVPPEDRTVHVSGNAEDTFSWPPHEGPIFQHSSTLVPYIRRLLATTRNVGIVGMPGIGKTTIADAVFECATRDQHFDATIWLSVGPGHLDLFELLKYAFRELAPACQRKTKDDKKPGLYLPNFSNAERGLLALQRRVQKHDLNVLLVLDDARHSSIVKSLNFVTSSDQAEGGSRLLVTTRQRSTLQTLRETLRPLRHGYCQPPNSLRQLEVVEVPCLSDQHALQLFHYHAFKVTRKATVIALQRQQPQMDLWCQANPKKLEVGLAFKHTSDQLMDCDAKWSAKLSQQVDDCGGNPGALQQLAIKVQPRHEGHQRAQFFHQFVAHRKDQEDDVSKECEEVIDGLLPSERDCFIACAAIPEGYWAPEATLLHLFATHAPLHVPASVASAKVKLKTLVDRSLLCETIDSGRRWYSLHRILHRLALIRAHSSGRDKEREGTRSFERAATSAEEKQAVQYLSLHGDTCLLEVMPSMDKLQACIITRARPSSITKDVEASKWPRKLQLLNVAFDRRDDVADQAWQSEPCNGDLFLLNSLCLAGERAPLILLMRLLHARQLLHIDLSGCVSLKELPECIGDCYQLLYLHLSGCTSLQKLPDRLGECKVLADLDLGDCSTLLKLPLTIGGCSGLTHLRLSECSKLRRLPDSIATCRKLVRLGLNGCSALASDCRGMPELIDGWEALKHLDLHGCSTLTTLPRTITYCSRLQYLCLSACCNLESLPEELGNCKELVHLDVSDCLELEVAASLEVVSLKHVSLAGLLITEVPTFVISLSRLTHLDLSRCATLEQLPQSEPGWPLLEHLDLSTCSTHLQTSQGLTRLTELNLGMMMHLDLSQCAEMSELTVALDNLSRLAYLSLQNCPKLVTLPEGLGCCSQLTHLDLSMCSQLQRLPMAKTIGCHLAYLNLAGCGLCDMEQLYGYIGAALVHIELSGCSRLQSVPDCWGNCSQLTHLDLEGCSKIERLPPSIRQCTQLAHLNLKDCSSMADLQDCVGVCTFLTEVNLSGCKEVQGLPECIGMCLQLARLDLSGCTGIRSLPGSLAYCSRLQCFVVQLAKVPQVADLRIFMKKEDVQERNSKVVTYMHSDQWGPGAQGNNELFAC